MKILTILLASLTLAGGNMTVQAQTFQVLHIFGTDNNDPTEPSNPGFITQGRNGEIYGTSQETASNVNNQSAFSITTAGTPSIIYTFSNPGQPYSGVTLGADGNLYGTTAFGGSFGYGTVYRVTPSGTLTVLYSFTGGSDGLYPNTPPVQGIDGNFYGTMSNGGSIGCGIIYKLTSLGSFTTVYDFDETHGCNPEAPLVQGTDGAFYGTAVNGGSASFGVIFKITPSGKLTVIHDGGDLDGNFTIVLTQGRDGNFYGVTSNGGTDFDGTIFKVTPSGAFTILHDLNENDGLGIGTGLVQAADGNFYGVCGASNLGYGTIYKITPQGVFSDLFYFDDTNTGAEPLGLIQHTNGTLYGVTEQGGGAVGGGVFYSFDIGQKPFVSVLPGAAKRGKVVQLLGQGFTGATRVSFNGVRAKFKILEDTFLGAIVPPGATTGFVSVATPSGTLTSAKKFIVIP